MREEQDNLTGLTLTTHPKRLREDFSRFQNHTLFIDKKCEDEDIKATIKDSKVGSKAIITNTKLLVKSLSWLRVIEGTGTKSNMEVLHGKKGVAFLSTTSDFQSRIIPSINKTDVNPQKKMNCARCWGESFSHGEKKRESSLCESHTSDPLNPWVDLFHHQWRCNNQHLFSLETLQRHLVSTPSPESCECFKFGQNDNYPMIDSRCSEQCSPFLMSWSQVAGQRDELGGDLDDDVIRHRKAFWDKFKGHEEHLRRHLYRKDDVKQQGESLHQCPNEHRKSSPSASSANCNSLYPVELFKNSNSMLNTKNTEYESEYNETEATEYREQQSIKETNHREFRQVDEDIDLGTDENDENFDLEMSFIENNKEVTENVIVKSSGNDDEHEQREERSSRSVKRKNESEERKKIKQSSSEIVREKSKTACEDILSSSESKRKTNRQDFKLDSSGRIFEPIVVCSDNQLEKQSRNKQQSEERMRPAMPSLEDGICSTRVNTILPWQRRVGESADTSYTTVLSSHHHDVKIASLDVPQPRCEEAFTNIHHGRKYFALGDKGGWPEEQGAWKSNYGAWSGSTPRKQYQCTYCGKVYCRKYVLKIHMRTHTGYKPLQCPYCEKSFSDPSNMKKHVKLHENQDQVYTCDYCGRNFVRYRGLLNHIKCKHFLTPGFDLPAMQLSENRNSP